MKFETVLHATIETVGEAGVIFNPRFVRFYEWLLRRDEQQRTEIARLQAELDADDLMAGEAETFKPEYEKQLESRSSSEQNAVSWITHRCGQRWLIARQRP